MNTAFEFIRTVEEIAWRAGSYEDCEKPSKEEEEEKDEKNE